MSEPISLRAITEADLPTLYENQRDPEATEMVGFPARELEAFLAHRAKTEADPTNESRAIMVGENLAGDIVSWAQDGERRIGYWIGKQYWGRGVASAALKAFVAELTERPLYADVLKTNAGSIRVLEKAGYVLEGRARDRIRKEEFFRTSLAVARHFDDSDLELVTLAYLGASLVHGDHTEEGMLLLDEALAAVVLASIARLFVREPCFSR